MDSKTARMMLETLAAAHPRIVVTEKTVEVWRTALDGVDDGEAGEAVLALLRDNPHPPTPADVLRTIRDTRARACRAEAPDPRAVIPVHEAARQIVEDLEARMRSDGRIPNKARDRYGKV